MFAAELRALLRHTPVWVLLPVAAYLGWRLLPFNAGLSEQLLDHDPQPDSDLLEAYRTDVGAVHTSGLGCCQLMAIAVGMLLVLRDPRLRRPPRQPRRPLSAGRLAGPPARRPAEPPPAVSPAVPTPAGPSDAGHPSDGSPYALARATAVLLAKAAVAALVALALAIADLVAVLPYAGVRVSDHWALRELDARGGGVPPMGLTNWRVWEVVACAVICVAAWGVVGVGLGVMVGNWRRLAAILSGYLLIGAALFVIVTQSGSFLREVGFVLLVGLLAPVVIWCLMWVPALGTAAPIVVAATGVFAALAILRGHAALAHRMTPRVDGRLPPQPSIRQG